MFNRSETKNIELTPELAALERQLSGLDVAPLRVDRDRLMFEAGRAAGRVERELAAMQRIAGAPRWVWPATAALMTAACVVLAAMLVWRGDAELVAQREAKPQAVGLPGIEAPMREELREVERVAANVRTSIWPIRPAGGYLEQRYIALTRGVSEVPFGADRSFSSGPTDAAQPATARELLRDLVPPHASPPHSRS